MSNPFGFRRDAYNLRLLRADSGTLREFAMIMNKLTPHHGEEIIVSDGRRRFAGIFSIGWAVNTPFPHFTFASSGRGPSFDFWPEDIVAIWDPMGDGPICINFKDIEIYA